MRRITVFADPSALARQAAETLVQQARESIEARGQFILALSGGSTPKALFSLLASDPFRSQIDWQNIEFFWGDERSVPPDHPDSNFRMANEAMLSRVPVPPEHIHRIRAELPPEETAKMYAHEIASIVSRKAPGDSPGGAPENSPEFDCILLGLGPDGHTASLFPGSEALKATEATVVANWVEKFKTWRITMTAPLINRARRVMFLTAGDEKAAPLREVIEGERRPELYPAQLIEPEGELIWLVDRAAA